METTDTCPNTVTGVSAHLFITLVNAVLSSKCAFNPQTIYPKDYGPNLRDGDQFDFIIVGSGSAGSVVANKLAYNQNYSVLVLEAGDYPSATSDIPALLFSLQRTEEDWQYFTEPSPFACKGYRNQVCSWPRGKMVGGTSSMNAMLYVRGNRRDYDDWAALGNPNWDYESVLQHFKQNENLPEQFLSGSTSYGREGLLGLSRYELPDEFKVSLHKGAAELGIPTVQEEKPIGYFEAVLTIVNGERENSAKAFLGPLKNSQNLHLATKAFVTKVLIDSSTKSAKGVQVQINGTTLNLYAKKETILSAGTLNSAQLLMLSGVGPKNHLEQHEITVIQDSAVGQNLQDHLMFSGLFFKINKSYKNSPTPAETVDGLYDYFMHRQGMLATIGLTNSLGFINTKNDSSYPNIELIHLLAEANDSLILPTFLNIMNLQPETISYILEENKQKMIGAIGPTILIPKSKGKLLLNTTNPFDHPLIYADYLTDLLHEDFNTMFEAISFIVDLLNTSALFKYEIELLNVAGENCKLYAFKSDAYWKCLIRRLSTSIWHPVGSCKMGPATDNKAVVDPRLRVHGLTNLRVIDASIMPTIVSGNINGPTMMIGLKGAEMILEDWSN